MIDFSPAIAPLWSDEKRAAIEAIQEAKEIALTFLAGEREKIMRMSHKDALNELLKLHRIDSRIEVIKGVAANNIMSLT